MLAFVDMPDVEAESDVGDTATNAMVAQLRCTDQMCLRSMNLTVDPTPSQAAEEFMLHTSTACIKYNGCQACLLATTSNFT